MRSSVNAYRVSNMEGATHLDVLLACYDALAEDIQLAGIAAEGGDIAARCRHSQHALLLLGHLESWIPLLENDEIEQSLRDFYVFLRKELLCLQSSIASSAFADLAMRICETRAVWQKKKQMMLSTEPLAAELTANTDDSQIRTRLCCLA